jgi:hypothetical protein
LVELIVARQGYSSPDKGTAELAQTDRRVGLRRRYRR